MKENIQIRPLEAADRAAALELFNHSAEKGEAIYSPLSKQQFEHDFFRPGMVAFVAQAGEEVVGFVHGTQLTQFLPKQTHENTPGYISCVFVKDGHRRHGIGKALVQRLEKHFLDQGKATMVCSDQNPLQLSWRIPGTPGHDHNKAPGAEESSAGYAFLKALGYEPRYREVAMYRDLKDYSFPDNTAQRQAELAKEGVYTGRYDASLNYDFDGMCDRVGSEYWRNVLKTETVAWQLGLPNADESLWVDGKKPAGPRPILVATHEDKIVGFTGPVDLQRSGRGWFTGICVDPLYGRRGIGDVLFQLLMQEFVDEGATFSTLFTGTENHAQRIYERAGLYVVAHFAVMSKPLVKDASYSGTHF